MLAAARSLQNTVVETSSGKVRGSSRINGLAFTGIPYGADTGGNSRFTAPKPPRHWAGVREATDFGPRAPQIDRPHPAGFDWLFSKHKASEDCLVLNVFTSDVYGKRPVMVWLHGGAFAFGSADVPVLDGGNLATCGDAVVVTVNHRLSVFGYLSPVSNEPEFADAGNVGMLDLVQALKWVRENISRFGGDPDNVTIFGQSGGGAKVAILMAMPAAEGLFHRAIIQSPSSGFRVQEPDRAKEFTEMLLKRFSLRNSDFARLQAIDSSLLLAAMNSVLVETGGEDFYRPVIDGRSIKGHPFYPKAPAQSSKIPLLIGYADTEASFYLALDPNRGNITPERLLARVKRFLKLEEDAASEIIAAYSANHPTATPLDLLTHISSDHMYRLTTIEGAEQKVRQNGAPVYLYNFGWQSLAMDGSLKSPHTAEIPFIFGHSDLARHFTGGVGETGGFARQMMATWSQFARSGDPNGGGLPEWTPFSLENRETMVLDWPTSSLHNDIRCKDRKVMASYPRFVPGSPLNFRAD